MPVKRRAGKQRAPPAPCLLLRAALLLSAPPTALRLLRPLCSLQDPV